MSGSEIWLVRHGETEWSRDHRHTSHTDVALTPDGEAAAKSLRERLAGEPFDLVVSSPRQRARRTAELAGFEAPEVLDDLVEWDYGTYEGRTTAEIREEQPDWSVWTRPSPGGESAADVTQRLDRALEGLRRYGRVLVFGHGHALRALTARWLGLGVRDGRLFRLDTATISVLGHERETPVILRWNS